MKMSLRNERESKRSSEEGKLRKFVTSKFTLKEWQKKFLKQTGMIKEGILRHQEGRKNTVSTNISKNNKLFFSF